MMLVENWRRVLARSFSVWLAVLSALLGSVEIWHADVVALLPYVTPYLSEGQAGRLSALVAALIPLSRIIRQVSLSTADAVRQEEQKG